MPELPDLIYIKKHLDKRLPGRTIWGVLVKQPIVLRTSLDRPIPELLTGTTFNSVDIHGPFIVFRLSEHLALIINLMLAGRLHIQEPGEKPPGHLCISLSLDNGEGFSMSDDQKMGKLYVVREGDEGSVPRFTEQGIDILGTGFTLEAFRALARTHRRKQVRVFVNDHTALSAIGNAYADEILFDAQIHPKTFISALPPEAVDTLFEAIRSVMAWGIAEVERAGQPIDVKVREHMKVRNRKGKPCLRCGGTIRREGVRGHDVFFCPRCQPASRKLFIDWGKV